jgi:hypothetical protein
VIRDDKEARAMAIRIRVYPQHHLIGARRNRMRRMHQQQLRQQLRAEAMLLRQQEQLRRQQLQVAIAGSNGSPFGYSTGIGSAVGYGMQGACGGYGWWMPGAYGVAQVGFPVSPGGFGLGSSPYLGSSMLDSWNSAHAWDPC